MDTKSKDVVIPDIDMDLKKKTREFIKKCHIAGIVHALEGGVMNLDEILIDFFKEHATELLEKHDEFVRDFLLENKCCEEIIPEWDNDKFIEKISKK